LKFIIFHLLLLSSVVFASSVDDFLKDSGVSLKNSAQLKIIKKFKTSSDLGRHFIFTAGDSKNNFYDVDLHFGMPSELASRTISNLSNLLKIAYGDKPSPYAGEITNLEKCPAEYQPKLISEKMGGQTISYFVSSAGSRFQYGACDKSTVHYTACSSFHYIPQKQLLIKLKYFVPKESNDCSGGIKSFYDGLVVK
jgi:hypothetical protein